FRYLVKNVRSGRVASMPVCAPRPTSTRSPDSSLPASWPSTITVTEPSGVLFVTRRSRMWNDQRADLERVRRHERDHHRVEAPDEHRAAVREVVGRRAERRRADDAVA